MKRFVSLFCTAILGISAAASGCIVTADSTEPEYTYTIQDVQNLQAFLLARPTAEKLAGRPYDLNHDGVWDTADLCLMKRELLSLENKEETRMQIEVNGHTLTASLADNTSAKALAELLSDGPLTLDLSDYGSFEKVGALPQSLPRNDERITTEPGDIILYQGNQITIYYDVNTWNFTRLGRIDNITQSELKEILGSGSVTVTLSLIN